MAPALLSFSQPNRFQHACLSAQRPGAPKRSAPRTNQQGRLEAESVQTPPRPSIPKWLDRTLSSLQTLVTPPKAAPEALSGVQMPPLQTPNASGSCSRWPGSAKARRTTARPPQNITRRCAAPHHAGANSQPNPHAPGHESTRPCHCGGLGFTAAAAGGGLLLS